MGGGIRGWLLAGMGMLLLAGCATVDDEALRLAETHRELADLKLRKGELERAIQEYEASLGIFDGDPEAHFGLSEAYRRKGLYDRAQRQLLRTLEIDPGDAEARLNLGVVYLHRGLYAKAIRENDRLIEDPSFVRPERALVNRGWAHYKSGSLEKAESDFRAGVAKAEENYQAHLDLGIVLYDRGEVVEAVQEFEKVLAILEPRPPAAVGPAQAQARFRLAQALVRLGQQGRAVEQLRAAAREGGQGEWGRRSRDYLAGLE